MNDLPALETYIPNLKGYNPKKAKIFASLTARNLGDFVGQNIVAASIKSHFDSATLVVEANLSTETHRHIVEYNPHIDLLFKFSEKTPVPMAVFDCYSGGMRLESENWTRVDGRNSNILLAGRNLGVEAVPGLPFKSRLAYPESREDLSRQTLTDIGLDPSRWFSVFHWREPGYHDRPDEPLRDIRDRSSYLDTMRHIIEGQGGQVVRIGHFGSRPLPDNLNSVIDLSQMPNSFDLQIFAISRARYFVGSCTGPNVLGAAFGTPSLITNQLGPDAVWNPGDLCLTQTVETRDGRLLNGEQLFSAGMLNSGILKRLTRNTEEGITVHQNTSHEIIRNADIMLERTSDCTGWRVPDPIGPMPAEKPNFIRLPLRSAFDINMFATTQ